MVYMRWDVSLIFFCLGLDPRRVDWMVVRIRSTDGVVYICRKCSNSWGFAPDYIGTKNKLVMGYS